MTGWQFNYGPGNPVGRVYRDLIRKADWNLDGIPAVDEPRISMEELSAKPTGMVRELNINDEQ